MPNFDLNSDLSEKRDRQSVKHSQRKTSPDEGRMISTKLVPANAYFSIRDNLYRDSNVTKESDLQPASIPHPRLEPMKEE
jgi:hypothetical protein